MLAHGPESPPDAEKETEEQQASLNDGDPVGEQRRKMLLRQAEQVPVEAQGIGEHIYNIAIVNHDRGQTEGDPGEDPGRDQHGGRGQGQGPGGCFFAGERFGQTGAGQKEPG